MGADTSAVAAVPSLSSAGAGDADGVADADDCLDFVGSGDGDERDAFSTPRW